MRPSTTRSVLRYFHIAIGIAVAAFIYSPTLQSVAAFEAVLRFVAVPAIAISGLLMWKPKLLRRRAG